jgi:hypothetical protein
MFLNIYEDAIDLPKPYFPNANLDKNPSSGVDMGFSDVNSPAKGKLRVNATFFSLGQHPIGQVKGQAWLYS